MRHRGDTYPPPDGPADPTRVADWSAATFGTPDYRLPPNPKDASLDAWPDDPVADPEAAADSIADESPPA